MKYWWYFIGKERVRFLTHKQNFQHIKKATLFFHLSHSKHFNEIGTGGLCRRLNSMIYRERSKAANLSFVVCQGLYDLRAFLYLSFLITTLQQSFFCIILKITYVLHVYISWRFWGFSSFWCFLLYTPYFCDEISAANLFAPITILSSIEQRCLLFSILLAKWFDVNFNWFHSGS